MKWANFELAEVGFWTKEMVLASWAPMEYNEINEDILTSEEKVIMKRPHTTRDLYLHKMGRKLLAYLKELRQSTNICIELASRPDLLGLSGFSHLGAVICRTFNVIDGSMIAFPVEQWLAGGFYRTHTLILHGDAGLGKTPLAMTLLAEAAVVLQQGCGWPPYYIKVGTVESLRDAATNGSMKSKVPILFDDLSPDRACGTRAGMPIEMLKMILEVSQSSSVHARFKDLVFASEQPRIFTANAATPHEWHRSLPQNVFEMTNDTRAGLDFNIKAAFKRCCFAFVGHAIVPAGAREQHQHARRSGSSHD